MSVTYLAVSIEARAELARLAPVYGTELEDGRFVAKVRGPMGVLPDGVQVIGADAADARRAIHEPLARGGVVGLRARASVPLGAP